MVVLFSRLRDVIPLGPRAPLCPVMVGDPRGIGLVWSGLGKASASPFRLRNPIIPLGWNLRLSGLGFLDCALVSRKWGSAESRESREARNVQCALY